MSEMYSSNTPKRLYRSRKDRVIAGVCGGIADYFNVDPVLIRLIFVLIFFLGFGILFLVYIIAWIIVPLAPSDSDFIQNKQINK